jgi:formate hydrogenlyase subunit 4
MMVAALTEGGLVMSLLTLALVCRTTDLFVIARSVAALPHHDLPPVMLAFAGFFIALLAETCRYPFDNPATHLELTMIHEAMILEYSGKRLALLEWAAANKYMIFISLGANLFFPWGMDDTMAVASVIGSLALFILKCLLFCTAIALIESSMAKFRIFRLPDLLFTSFIISVIAIGLIV